MKYLHTIVSEISRKQIGSCSDQNLKKTYIARSISGVKQIDIFPKESIPPRGIQSIFHTKLRQTFSNLDADFALVPHEWSDIAKDHFYLDELKEISKVIPLVIFNTGDISPPVNLNNTIQIRTFLHPGENSKWKILIPYPTKRRIFKLRDWRPVPKVGFMGQIPKFSLGSLISSPFPSIRHPIKSSVYLSRVLAISKLKKIDAKIESDIVVRDSFSAFHKNSNLEKHTTEFQQQLNECDYILCPRGFGNTSIRFYESISAGRTPILIDTNGGLPELSQENSWDKHILRLNLGEDWSKQILRDWESLSPGDSYVKRQVGNRELFDNLLDFDKYMIKLFTGYLKVE